MEILVDRNPWRLTGLRTRAKASIKANRKTKARIGGTMETSAVRLLDVAEDVAKVEATKEKEKGNRKVRTKARAKTSARRANTKAR